MIRIRVRMSARAGFMRIREGDVKSRSNFTFTPCGERVQWRCQEKSKKGGFQLGENLFKDQKIDQKSTTFFHRPSGRCLAPATPQTERTESLRNAVPRYRLTLSKDDRPWYIQSKVTRGALPSL